MPERRALHRVAGPNLFTAQEAGEEIFETILSNAAVRIERIISNGNASPPGFWYDQHEHEWVTLLEGEASIAFEAHEITLKPGDHLLIPAHVRHRVNRTAADRPTIWLAIFSTTPFDKR